LKVPIIESLKKENSQLQEQVDSLVRGQKIMAELKQEQIQAYEDKVAQLEANLKNSPGFILPQPAPKNVFDKYSQHPVINAMNNGEVKLYISDTPYFASQNFDRAINHVTSHFESQSNSNVKFTRVSNQGDADIIVTWIKDFGGHGLGEAFPQYLNIGIGQTDCVGKWAPFDKETITRVITHEIGHALGFIHSDDENNVMYTTTGFRYDYFWKDIGDYQSSKFGNTGEGGELTLCKGEYFIEVVADKPVDVGLFNSKAVSTYEFKGQTFPKFESCKERNTTHYSRTCTVESSAWLNIFFFEEGEIVDYTVKVERLDELPSRSMDWDESAYRYPEIYSYIFG